MTNTVIFRGNKPAIAPSVYVAPSATVIGDVKIGEESSVWFGTVLRGDVESIRIGRRTNIQDLTMVHVTNGVAAAYIGDGVTIGHRAVVHGCTIHNDCLIGIGAIVLDGSEIGPESIVGAGAVVPPGQKVPPRTMVLGIPAKVVRHLEVRDFDAIRYASESYVKLRLEYMIEAFPQPSRSL